MGWDDIRKEGRKVEIININNFFNVLSWKRVGEGFWGVFFFCIGDFKEYLYVDENDY